MGDVTLVVRHDLAWLKSKVHVTESGCWEWKGAKATPRPGEQPYGVSFYRGRNYGAQRAAAQ